MAMMREPGFMGLAKQKAKREGMLEVPKRYQPDGGGPEEYPAFVNEQEMAMLKKQGGKGFMTPYGVPSFGWFDSDDDQPSGITASSSETPKQFEIGGSGELNVGGWLKERGVNVGADPNSNLHRQPGENAGQYHQRMTGGGVRDGGVYDTGSERGGYTPPPPKTPEQIEAERKAAAKTKYDTDRDSATKKHEEGKLGRKRSKHLEGRMVDAEGRTEEDRGVMTDASGKKEGEEGFDFETAEMKGGYDASTAKMDTTDSFEDYKQQSKGLGAKSKELTEGVMTDAEGKTEGQEGYDASTASMQGGFAGDVKKLGGYQSKFDQMATEAKTRGDAGQDYFQGAVGEDGKRTGGVAKDFKDTASAGASELQALGRGVMKDASGKTEGQEGYDSTTGSMQGGYAQITGDAQAEAAKRGETAATTAAGEIKTAAGQGQTAAQTGVTAAGEGATGFKEGAQDVGAVKKQFGKEGFQAESGALQDKVGGYESKIAGMADKVASGEAGQSQAAMLKGQMEEGRMASQKGSEEKLRREMAQSGASPSEIAAKVAQFQKQSSADQAQAGRSEALSSQLQGQQMGQQQMGAAAGLTGQAMGAVGQQAGMLGQRAGMAGQQASLGAQQAAMRGQAAGMQMKGAEMGMAGAQMGMQGAQSAGQMGMAGANMGMQGAAAQQNAQLASLQGQGAMSQAATGMNMQGIQGAANMYGQGMQAGMQGANQQASMMGQGMGAVQAAGGARQQQMGGLDQQAGFIDQQGNYTQAQLNDVIAQQTQNFSADQAEKTRQANAAANSGGGGGGGGGFLSGISNAVSSVGKMFSDIRLKDSIELLQEGMDGEPNIYSFKYKWDSKTTWSGVMAQELIGTKHAGAVKVNPEGYYMVDYHKLGIPMVQLSAKEQHGI